MSTSAVTQEAFNLFDVLPKWDHFAFSTKGRAIKFLNSNGYSSNLSNTVNFEGFGGFGGEKGKPKVFASLLLSKSSARIQRILNDFNRAVQLHCDRIPLGFGSIGLSTGESGLRENGGGMLEGQGFNLNGVGVEKPKKVLILMSDTGGGHRASAEAIKVAFHEEFGEEYQVFVTDLWSEHTPWPFNQLPRSYNFLVKHATLWRATYYLSVPRLVHQTNFAFWSPFIARTRVMQKLLARLSTSHQIAIIVNALIPVTVHLTKDMYGHHVIQHCVKHFSIEYTQYLLEAVTTNCVNIATNCNGCCVLQTCVNHAQGKIMEHILTEIIRNALVLANDPYGNYVVQHVLEKKIPHATSKLLKKFEGKFASLSTQKFSSNIVEKCLKESNHEQCMMIIEELVDGKDILLLLQDAFGNYVIQTALEEAYKVTRLYKDKEHAEVEFTVGPIPTEDNIGKEVITRLTANMATNATIYTNSNGRDFLKRVRDYRVDWSLSITQPIAGNYYPLNLGIYTSDKTSELSVLVDRATGGASIEDGELELMFHRRMIYDDGKGVGEPLDETVCITDTCQGLTVC